MKLQFTMLVFTIVLISINAVAQQPCTLDNTFDTDGRIISDAGMLADRIVALDNGKCLVIYNSFGNGHAHVRRLNSDGSIDYSYGTSGKTTIQVSTSSTDIYGTLLHNGKLTVCGTTNPGTNTYAFAARLQENGKLDSTFGNNGIVAFTTYYRFNDMILEPITGKIIVAGMKDFDIATVTRLHANGFMDGSFGNLGSTEVFSAASNIYYEIHDVNIDKNNKILITGKHYANQGTSIFTQVCVMRFTDNGQLDVTFDTDGKAYYNSAANNYDEGRKLFVNSSNQYYIIGATYDNNDYDYSLLRVNNNGTADNSFGTNGWFLYDLSGNQEEEYLLNGEMLANENIILSGNQGSGDTVHFSMLMVKPDGSTEQIFAPNGLYLNIFGQNNSNSSAGLSIAPDGKIYLSGYTRTCQGGTCGPLYAGLARYVGAAIPTSIDPVENEQPILIFPNPISGDNKFSIIKDIKNLKVYDCLGKEIPCEAMGPHRYKLHHANPGIYFIRGMVDDSAFVQKVVVE